MADARPTLVHGAAIYAQRVRTVQPPDDRTYSAEVTSFPSNLLHHRSARAAFPHALKYHTIPLPYCQAFFQGKSQNRTAFFVKNGDWKNLPQAGALTVVFDKCEALWHTLGMSVSMNTGKSACRSMRLFFRGTTHISAIPKAQITPKPTTNSMPPLIHRNFMILSHFTTMSVLICCNAAEMMSTGIAASIIINPTALGSYIVKCGGKVYI